MVESDHPDSRFPIDILSLCRFLARAQEEVRLEGEVNVRITSDAEMRRLNREFRRKDKPTDVLSFPSSLNGNPDLAGDIAISADIAYANAGTLGHPFEEELKVLMLHGLLHLAGYDHETDQGEMARREQRLRVNLNLPTTLIARTGAITKALGKARTLASRKSPSPPLRKGTTLVVPSKAKQNPNTSLPKAAAQRKRSGHKKSTPFSRTIRTSGAKADSHGTAKAVPFPKTETSSSSNPRFARRRP